VSAAQLGVGVVSLAVARRRNHAYHFLMLRGRPENIGRDAIVMGTAFSAPIVMLAVQGVATARLARRADARAERVLGVLGVAMITGYLGESLVRQRLRPSGYDPVESPLVIIGLGLAGAMAVVGLSARRVR
jgi:hypothetical protein